MKYAYCLLDTETTGLRLGRDQAYSIAWMFVDAHTLLPIRSNLYHYYLNVSVPFDEISDFTLDSVSWLNYCCNKKSRVTPFDAMERLFSQIHDLKSGGHFGHGVPYTGVYLVGANPRFDDRMLETADSYLHREAPYKYRLIDLENVAMKPMGRLVPPGFHEVVKHYLGPDIVQPHTAEGDVLLLQDVLTAMRDRGDI